jgi:hypothetical protein
MTHKKKPEDYRRLAAKCREAARKVSTEKERDDLLARAETFDFLSSVLRNWMNRLEHWG